MSVAPGDAWAAELAAGRTADAVHGADSHIGSLKGIVAPGSDSCNCACASTCRKPLQPPKEYRRQGACMLQLLQWGVALQMQMCWEPSPGAKPWFVCNLRCSCPCTSAPLPGGREIQAQAGNTDVCATWSVAGCGEAVVPYSPECAHL
jgi:hypothetical protein